MNNKYDVNNFSKILEEYNNEEEVKSIEAHLFSTSPDVNVHKFGFV
jgi:hypothetical protein